MPVLPHMCLIIASTAEFDRAVFPQACPFLKIAVMAMANAQGY